MALNIFSEGLLISAMDTEAAAPDNPPQNMPIDEPGAERLVRDLQISPWPRHRTFLSVRSSSV